MNTLPDVIPLTPYYREMVWGGRRLAALYGKALPDDALIGESFELSAYEGRASRAADGRSLRALLKTHRADLVGAAVWERYGGCFPLLVKLLDAQQDLSIQVHPSDEYARRHGLADGGKMEAWYVLQSDGGRVACGLAEGVGRAEFVAAHAANRVAEVVRFYPVAQGDVLFLPPGTVHALCRGVVLYEVQQASDLTFRIYDYGRPRALHWEQALAVIDFAQRLPGPVPHPVLQDQVLVESEHFVLRGCGLDGGRAEHRAGASFLSLTVVRGRARVGECIVGAGATALVPAGRGCEVAPLGSERLEYLIASVPT